ncbi:MAG TPA: helix-turn-helix transcriptional regulator [Cytophagales bacterium]|nr:helix-turn-helix transcriptional regulator [Cytophagales bacterium]
MKNIHKTFKDIATLFNSLRFFYDKIPDRDEVIDYKEVLNIQKLAHQTSAGIFFYYVADLQNLKIVEVGGSLQSLTGLKPTDVEGRNFAYALKIFRWTEIPDILKGMIKYHEYMYAKPIQDRLMIKGSVVLNVKHKNGTYFTGLLQAMPLAVDSKGHVSHMYSSITDISRFHLDPNAIKGDIIDESNKEQVVIINIIDKTLNATMELTNAEIRVLKLISEGKSTKEISDLLCLSEHTINNHRKNMMHKTKVKNTAELISKTITLSQAH